MQVSLWEIRRRRVGCNLRRIPQLCSGGAGFRTQVTVTAVAFSRGSFCMFISRMCKPSTARGLAGNSLNVKAHAPCPKPCAYLFSHFPNCVIVDLQCCVYFCCPAQWFRCIYISTLFHILFHCTSWRNVKHSSLCSKSPTCKSADFQRPWTWVHRFSHISQFYLRRHC